MKILYDFRAYQAFRHRGIGRYVWETFTRAISLDTDKVNVLIDNGLDVPTFSAELKRVIEICSVTDFQAGKFAENEFDVLLCGASMQPGVPGAAVDIQYAPELLRSCRTTACVLHDFIPVFFQGYIGNLTERRNFALQIEATRRVDHIFTNSLFTLYSGMRYLNRPAEDFTCLYGGADEKLFSAVAKNTEYIPSKREPHLIYVSGDAPQKNNRGAVRAFCAAYKRGNLPKDARFYLVCKASEQMIAMVRSETERAGLKYGKQVLATNFIPDEELVELLTTARASFFPSYYEGLGLPILESYVAGTPCWASCISATREFVLRECSFDPFSETSMSDAIETIYTNDALCVRSLKFGQELVKKINWDAAADKMMNRLKELVERR